MPYTWPMDPDAEATRAAGRGTCAGKHAVLREELSVLGLHSSRLMVVGPLAPAVWPDLVARSKGLREVHECLTVETPWAGPLRVDVTWHPAAIVCGLTGTLDWDGTSDMVCAVDVEASYAVGDERAEGIAQGTVVHAPAAPAAGRHSAGDRTACRFLRPRRLRYCERRA
jgi:hypothetical protein